MVFDSQVRAELEGLAEGRYAKILKAFETGDLRHAYPTPTQGVKAIFETQCWVLDSYLSPEFPLGELTSDSPTDSAKYTSRIRLYF